MNVSVIIPAYNEEKHIEKVLDVVRKNKIVNEILVVDNNSVDNTANICKKCGVKTVFCKSQGKGYAIETGEKNITGEILVLIDADICNYESNFIDKMVEPILNDRADFVKATFKRDAGRVTELVAKPLLELTYPKLGLFEQPLSGIIACKTDIFKKIELEKDYGVDVGILIDLYNLNVRMEQVNIGEIINDSQDWRDLKKMAKEVAYAIVSRGYIKK